MKVLLNIWQLPQLILGCICSLIFKGEYITYNDSILITCNIRSAFSLGKYIFINKDLIYINGTSIYSHTVKHEYAHSKQSMMLGWLYIPIIAIPSIGWNIYRLIFKTSKSYYWFYTEAWAENLIE